MGCSHLLLILAACTLLQNHSIGLSLLIPPMSLLILTASLSQIDAPAASSVPATGFGRLFG
jgi:hypothetical protein